ELLEESLDGDEDAVAGCDLIVRRRIADLHDLFIANWQHHAATIRRSRPAQCDSSKVGAVGHTACGEDGVEDRLTASEREGAGGVHLAEDIKDLALPRDDTHGDRASVLRLGIYDSARFPLDLVDRLARDDQSAILTEVDGPIGKYRLVAGQTH